MQNLRNFLAVNSSSITFKNQKLYNLLHSIGYKEINVLEKIAKQLIPLPDDTFSDTDNVDPIALLPILQRLSHLIKTNLLILFIHDGSTLIYSTYYENIISTQCYCPNCSIALGYDKDPTLNSRMRPSLRKKLMIDLKNNVTNDYLIKAVNVLPIVIEVSSAETSTSDQRFILNDWYASYLPSELTSMLINKSAKSLLECSSIPKCINYTTRMDYIPLSKTSIPYNNYQSNTSHITRFTYPILFDPKLFLHSKHVYNQIVAFWISAFNNASISIDSTITNLLLTTLESPSLNVSSPSTTDEILKQTGSHTVITSSRINFDILKPLSSHGTSVQHLNGISASPIIMQPNESIPLQIRQSNNKLLTKNVVSHRQNGHLNSTVHTDVGLHVANFHTTIDIVKSNLKDLNNVDGCGFFNFIPRVLWHCVPYSVPILISVQHYNHSNKLDQGNNYSSDNENFMQSLALYGFFKNGKFVKYAVILCDQGIIPSNLRPIIFFNEYSNDISYQDLTINEFYSYLLGLTHDAIHVPTLMLNLIKNILKVVSFHDILEIQNLISSNVNFALNNDRDLNQAESVNSVLHELCYDNFGNWEVYLHESSPYKVILHDRLGEGNFTDSNTKRVYINSSSVYSLPAKVSIVTDQIWPSYLLPPPLVLKALSPQCSVIFNEERKQYVLDEQEVSSCNRAQMWSCKCLSTSDNGMLSGRSLTYSFGFRNLGNSLTIDRLILPCGKQIYFDVKSVDHSFTFEHLSLHECTKDLFRYCKNIPNDNAFQFTQSANLLVSWFILPQSNTDLNELNKSLNSIESFKLTTKRSNSFSFDVNDSKYEKFVPLSTCEDDSLVFNCAQYGVCQVCSNQYASSWIAQFCSHQHKIL